MNRVDEIFGTSPVLLPVVHPIGREAALAAVDVVREVGAPGVFLIDQGMIERDVLALAREVRARHPSLWIGLNLLSRDPAEALVVAIGACNADVDGIWSDDAGVDDRGVRSRAEQFVTVRRRLGWRGLYFGGVAFKYQREIGRDDLGKVAASAVPYVDVVCTSGPGTGMAADVSKVAVMGEAIGPDHALALASGVTPENVRNFLPHTRAFLVGTGLESRLGVLDPAKIEALLRALRGA